MIHRFPVGTKEQNDLLILPLGAICIDGNESLRVHNGEQSGGGILELERAVELPFKGEVTVSELIDGPTLATLVGLSAGTAFNSNEPWLKFIDPIDNKTKFIAKKPYRHSISWDQLNAVGIAHGKEITIGSNQYICRLPRVLNPDKYLSETNHNYFSGNAGWNSDMTWGSEWNRLMYPICAPTGNATYDNIQDPTSPGLGAWAQYDQDNGLGLRHPGIGYTQWCIEYKSSTNVTVGFYSVVFTELKSSNRAFNDVAWRPLLELID